MTRWETVYPGYQFRNDDDNMCTVTYRNSGHLYYCQEEIPVCDYPYTVETGERRYTEIELKRMLKCKYIDWRTEED